MPDDTPKRIELRWRLERRDIYREKAWIIESISAEHSEDVPRTFWTLRGHFTHDEMLGLKAAIDEVISGAES